MTYRLTGGNRRPREGGGGRAGAAHIPGRGKLHLQGMRDQETRVTSLWLVSQPRHRSAGAETGAVPATQRRSGSAGKLPATPEPDASPPSAGTLPRTSHRTRKTRARAPLCAGSPLLAFNSSVWPDALPHTQKLFSGCKTNYTHRRYFENILKSLSYFPLRNSPSALRIGVTSSLWGPFPL